MKNEFEAHSRRALILTTVDHESRAVKAHLAHSEILIGERGAFYEYGRFSDPAGDWLVVHAITSQGNSDAGLAASKAFQEFGRFQVLMFVGVAGALKEDIPIGSVVIGDYVYNGHSAKVGDAGTLARPHALAPPRELLTTAQALIYLQEWSDLVKAPVGMELPTKEHYPCAFPPSAFIKGIVSGEEVVAGDKSARYAQIRTSFNDAGAVEMEGWGVMNAAHYENAPVIIVRGISDMCAGKEHAKDRLHQPIAAAHAAAFAFSILSFRSKVPVPEAPVLHLEPIAVQPAADSQATEERRVDFVFNFEGSKEQWTEEKTAAVVERIRRTLDDDTLTLVRIEVGSVRLVLSIRERNLESMNLEEIRVAVADAGGTLLGATRADQLSSTNEAKAALADASADLLAWDQGLPNGRWMDRPERESVEARFELRTSSTVLLGEPGSGKSALLSRIACDLLRHGSSVFALKADFISTEVRTEADLQQELRLPALPSDLILRLAILQPVYVLIDQLDALASQLDLRSWRLNVLLNMIRRIGGKQNVHLVLSARTFEFNHDVRLRTIEAQSVNLALPPWHEVKAGLVEVGIDPDAWPEKAREVVRIPQALKTFIALVKSGRTEPFSTYQAMLEQLWNERVASAEDSEVLILLASDLAEKMAEEEALWLAAARFDDRLKALRRLEALGFIVRSENNLSIAFAHQTIFDYVLARTFVRSSGLLSSYVLERQDSLFVRAKVWSAMNYLREAEVGSYEREFLQIWQTKDLRRHLRLLLIEFLGQVIEPHDFEKSCMAKVLKLPELHLFGLKAIGSSSGWFRYFASSAIRDAMVGTESQSSQACRILSLNWTTDMERVVELIKDCWVPLKKKDSDTWMAVRACAYWTGDVEKIALTILARSPIAIWAVESTAVTLAVAQPETAIRLVRAKLDFLLAEAVAASDLSAFPFEGTQDQKTDWTMRNRRSKELEAVLDSTEWNEIASLAEAAPASFVQTLWPWYKEIFSAIVAAKGPGADDFLYSGQYFLELKTKFADATPVSDEKPLIDSVQIAIEALSSEQFLVWVEENANLEIMLAQQLIARGFEVAGEKLAGPALEWLIADQRRFQLGSVYAHRKSTIDLVEACAPYWSSDELEKFQQMVVSYRPRSPERFADLEQRRLFTNMVRATRKDLLQALGYERLAPANRELAATEQRALGGRFDRSIGAIGGGFIGSPMDAAAMSKAKDRDILKIFREIPDSTDWDHPTHWMRGGSIQLSRAFAEFSRTDPVRAIRLIEYFEPLQQERAAGYALEAMAGDAPNDSRLLEALLDLHSRGFRSDEFVGPASSAIEKIASRKSDIGEDVLGILIEWLSRFSTLKENQGLGEDSEDSSDSGEEGLKDDSILWGHGHSSILPGGSFNILSAISSILLTRGDSDRNRYLEILNNHLSREPNPKLWRALLYRLRYGGRSSELLSNFLRNLFDRLPEILNTREAVIFLAYAYHWDDKLVFDYINEWPKSEQEFKQRAYGELVGLIATVRATSHWIQARDEIIISGNDQMKTGLAYAAVNMWSDQRFRPSAGETLVALLKGAGKQLVSAVMDVFRVVDDLAPDEITANLLRALADSGADISAAPSHFVVDRLQALLPHEADLIAALARRLVEAWRSELGDMSTGTAMAAPQLTDLALTLHRLGGSSRRAGVALFETMIEIDAYGAKETLAEIDGRFGPRVAVARQRLARRRRSGSQRRRVGGAVSRSA